MYKRFGNKFYCFSPPVMLATFVIEFGFAFYTLWRYKLTTVSRLVVSMLFLLGLFQLTEYMICGGLGMGHAAWARLGYVAITLLPALGLHLVATLGKLKLKPLVIAAYMTAIAYVGYFAFAGNSVVGDVCTTNYAVFRVHGLGSVVYGVYYYGWLLATMAIAAVASNKKTSQMNSLRWMVFGYASFILPTTAANLVNPATLGGIPSIMCGFAVLLAIVLVWRVLPLSKTPLRLAVPSKAKRKRA